MLTFQDFLRESEDGGREAFILRAIAEHKSSAAYRNAVVAQTYYATENVEISKRLTYLERKMRNKVNVKFHRLRNGFFPKAVKRLVLYLMGNGSMLEADIKAQIDKKFDRIMIQAAINACVDGAVWIFADVGRLNVFRTTEFVPLFDERTNNISAGIRFWQIDAQKPVYIELYELDGISEYKSAGAELFETAPKRPYKQTVRRDAFQTEVINGENYGVLPVVPLYANELHASELSPGLKSLIDAHDFISSDLVDGITLIEGIYWVVKNYGGQDAAQLIAELQELKATLVEGGDTGADPRTLEVPFQAKQAALEMLERRMYADWLLPDNQRSARSVTATEIKMSREDMDIKADLLEWQVAECIEDILRLKGLGSSLPDFKRRTTINDTESVKNISTQLGGGWIDEKEAVWLDPTIPADRKEALMQRL